MPDLDQLFQHAEPGGGDPHTPAAFEGTFARDVANLNDLALIDFDGHKVGPVPWMPRGTTLPQRGDRALITLSDAGEYWVSAWDGPNAFPDAGTGDLHFTFSQPTPSASWVIAHDLGKIPSVLVVADDGSIWEPDEITYADLDHTTLDFGSNMIAGFAYMN